MLRIKKTSFIIGDRYFCPSCHKKVGFFDSFCRACGHKVEWERCPHCNRCSELKKGGFCTYCGKALLRG